MDMGIDHLSAHINDPNRRSSLEKRMAAKTNIGSPEGCWEWIAKTVTDFGYGSIGSGRGVSPFKAHRVAWALKNGPIPKGMCVCHRCDNPPCVNPDHLFLGTKKDNTRDMVSKGRMVAPPRSYGIKHHNAKFGPNEVHKIISDTRLAIDIAAEYGVCSQTIYRHKRGNTWIQGINNG